MHLSKTTCAKAYLLISGRLWRSRAAAALWAAGLMALALTVLGAAVAPLSYLPQGAFASSVVLLLGACWLSEGGR